MDGENLGEFCDGDVVNFGEGVESFTISGITPLVDAEYIESEAIFPIQVLFDSPSASVTVTPLEPDEFGMPNSFWNHNTCELND